MFERTTLGNTGIEVIKKLEDEKIIDIVNQVSTRLMVAYPESKLSYLDIYKTLLDTPMYYAKIPEGLSKVNYYYKDSGLYFAEDVDLSEIDEYVLHECVHKLQERKGKRGNITRLGVCEVNELSVKATALNEGAIQYITSNAFNNTEKMVNIYNISVPSKTEYYPIITNIVTSLVYLIGKEVLIDSTINGNENFKIEIIDNLGENQYNAIERNLNEILKLKNEILELQKVKENDTEKILEDIKTIRNIYFDTQNLIYTSYFNDALKRTEDEFEVKMLKSKLYGYKNIIGTASDYTDFDIYCIDFEDAANSKIDELKNRKALAVIKDNILFRIIKRIRAIFSSKPNVTKQN